jgi:hypothetical protein
MADLIILIFRFMFILGYFGAMWMGYTNASGAFGKTFFFILGVVPFFGLLFSIWDLIQSDQGSSYSSDDIKYRASDNYNDWRDDGDSGE